MMSRTTYNKNPFLSPQNELVCGSVDLDLGCGDLDLGNVGACFDLFRLEAFIFSFRALILSEYLDVSSRCLVYSWFTFVINSSVISLFIWVM